MATESRMDRSAGHIDPSISISWYLAALGISSEIQDMRPIMSSETTALTDLEWNDLLHMEGNAIGQCDAFRGLFKLSFAPQANVACKLRFMISTISLEGTWDSFIALASPNPEKVSLRLDELQPYEQMLRCELELVVILWHNRSPNEAGQLLFTALERFLFHITDKKSLMSRLSSGTRKVGSFSIGEVPVRLLPLSPDNNSQDWILPTVNRIRNHLDAMFAFEVDLEFSAWNIYLELVSTGSQRLAKKGSRNFGSVRDWRRFNTLGDNRQQSMTAYLELILSVHALRDAGLSQQDSPEAFGALNYLSFTRRCITSLEDTGRKNDLTNALKIIVREVEQLVDSRESPNRPTEEERRLKEVLSQLKGD